MSQNLSSASVVIGALRVNTFNMQYSSYKHVITNIQTEWKNNVDHDQMASLEAI